MQLLCAEGCANANAAVLMGMVSAMIRFNIPALHWQAAQLHVLLC
jgi:hypothetical protein